MPTPIKLLALVLEVIQHTDDVKTILLQPAKRCPAFKPGQFLHLAMDPYDPSSNWPESRVLSIASSPMRRETLKIIFSVKGKFTRMMFDNIKKGDEIYIKLPYGSFTFPEDDRGLVLVAGGTGITPFLSYLEYALDARIQRNIVLYHGIRDPEHFVCGPLLSACSTSLKHFECYCYLEHGSELEDIAVAGKGFIPIEDIVRQRHLMPEALYYLSGPSEMVTSFTSALVLGNVPQGQIMVDAWE